MPLPYELIRFLKFAGVLGFAGGAVASLVARDLDSRRIAVHRVASPSLLVAWIGGYLLAEVLARPLSELWIVAGFALSFLTQGALVWSVSVEGRRGPRACVAVVGFLVANLAIMVWRPTWAMVGR